MIMQWELVTDVHGYGTILLQWISNEMGNFTEIKITLQYFEGIPASNTINIWSHKFHILYYISRPTSDSDYVMG